MHGLYVPEEEGDEPQVRECGRCQELNEPEAAFCMRCGYALKGETAADFEADVDEDVKQEYAETDPGDTATKEKLGTIDDFLDDPDVKTALLERMGKAEYAYLLVSCLRLSWVRSYEISCAAPISANSSNFSNTDSKYSSVIKRGLFTL